MSDRIIGFLFYIGELFLLTLGIFLVCGITVWLCARLFARLLGGGSGSVFDVTSVIGTPIHELGHAVMCLVFGHRIQRMKLWSARAENGVYGYVEHSYNRKNPWAQLGNLFIALGPIFSGLGVMVLMLWLCFPSQWNAYLASTHLVSANGSGVWEIASGVLSLLGSIPGAIVQDPVRSLLGIAVILPVSLHISLSWQDIKSGIGAMPMYLLILTVFGTATWLAGVAAPVLDGLWLLNLRMLSLFCIVILFSLVWVLIALIVRLVRVVATWF